VAAAIDKIRILSILRKSLHGAQPRMPTVNATEFQKHVGQYSDLARREPVTVTRHGRPSLVLLSAEDYERLKKIEAHGTKAVKVAKLPGATIKAMRSAKLSHLPD
jgi:prevent-host-death family protein